MPIAGKGWEILVTRRMVQTRGAATRTVGTYQVHHDGRPAPDILVGGVAVPLSGTTAEPRGPGQNKRPATRHSPSRILPGRYPMRTSGGPLYVTNGYRADLQIRQAMPGLELGGTGRRTDILIHPGKNEFISSIGCINPCTRLPDAAEDIDYAGSRRRVIALIEDMRRFFGGIPGTGDRPIANAWTVIDEAFVPGQSLSDAANGDGTVDGNALAARHGIGVKSAAVKISRLHASMGPAIVAVAQAVTALGLPRAVITSGNDSAHKPGSLHYQGKALDFRGNNISTARGRAFAADVGRRLGPDYDVLFEIFANTSNNHLHVEYDPR